MELDLLPAVDGLTFDEGEHAYHAHHPTHGRLRVASATQVMAATGAKEADFSNWKRSLIRQGMSADDAEDFMEAHRNKRAQIGTDFHSLVHCHLLGVRPPVVWEESIEMFGRWREEFLPRLGRVLLIESPLLHRPFLYAGTPDLLAEVDGVLTLIDWKTQQVGKEKVRPEWQLQGGAYWEAIRRCYGVTPERGLNLVITAAGVRLKRWNLADLKQGWERFAGFLSDYHAKQEGPAHRAALRALTPSLR